VNQAPEAISPPDAAGDRSSRRRWCGFDVAPARTVRTQRSANALAFGACTGVVMICAPSAANTSSKARVNLLSRSRIRNRGVVVSSGRSIKNSRAR
jgi:hypothetical protein